MKIYDISQEVFASAVFAGDPAPKREVLSSIEEGAVCNLTAFSMCAHNGTHIDAPYHFFNEGETVEKLDGKVTALEEKPVRRMNDLVDKVIWAVCAAVITFVLARIGL